MKLFTVTGTVFLAFVLVASAQNLDVRQANMRALVEAERAFAQAAATKGTRDAFLEFLSDDGVIFQPGPINGKDFWRQRQPRKGLLNWHPVFVDVSAAGDLGYTTGPYEFRPGGPDDKPTAFGQYFTIWKRQMDGSWKAVLDRGISHPAPTSASSDVQFATAAGAKSPKEIDAKSGRELILKTESDFARAAAQHGLRQAVSSYFADDVRILRENSFPVTGKLVGQGVVFPKPGIVTWQPAYADISRSADLGYSYGTYEFKAGTSGAVTDQGIYVRMWKRQASGRFKAVIDIQVPTPAR